MMAAMVGMSALVAGRTGMMSDSGSDKRESLAADKILLRVATLYSLHHTIYTGVVKEQASLFCGGAVLLLDSEIPLVS